MRKILAVDVDLTVVDSVTPWLEWYKKLTGHDLGKITNDNSNVEELMHNHNDPLSFWKKGDLYDDLEPIENTVEVLRKLSEHMDIIFVSACFPEHENSKKMFLNRNFPFMKGFISTSDKQYVKCDYFIDDYYKYVKLIYDTGVKCYQIKTDINSEHSDIPYMDITEICEDIIKDIL